MQSFLSLPNEKQNRILSAGFSCFGRMGYRKTSAADIAEKAEISKAMLFHYFGNKKSLYVYLLNTACKLVEEATNENAIDSRDFFDCVIADIKSKQSVIEMYPSILQFLTSALKEKNPEVVEEINKTKRYGINFHTKLCMENIDSSKFKEGVNLQLLFDLIIRYMESVSLSMAQEVNGNSKKIFNDAVSCIKMLKYNFYKDEFLED